MPSHTNDEFQFLHPSNEKTGEEASPDHDENLEGTLTGNDSFSAT